MPRKGKIKVNVFKNLENPNVQYWLGLLASDGCVTKDSSGYRIHIQLKYDDQQLLTEYCKFLGQGIEVYKVQDKRYENYYYGKVSFRSNEIGEFLVNLGITPKKTENLNLTIPVTWDYLRGFIDGDGSIQIIDKSRILRGKEIKTCGSIRIGICSKIHMLQVFNFLYLNDIEPKIYTTISGRKTRLYEIQINKSKDILEVLSKLYKNADIYLERKYHKAQDLSNMIRKISETQGTSIRNPEASEQLNVD